MINAMRNKWLLVIAVLILALAAAGRFYQLGVIPHGMTWDEAAIGYNGHAIVVARRDEWLVKLPISFRSFGDYKAPLAIYINGIFTTLWGMNLWAVRLPFALANVVGVALMMLMAHRVFSKSVPVVFPRLPAAAPAWLTLGSGWWLTTSPWHFHYSRVGFESGMALTFLLLGMWLLLEWLTVIKQTSTKRAWWPQAIILTAAAISLAASMYTYHSAKGVVPALVIMVMGLWWRRLWALKGTVITFLGVLFLALYPLLKDTFQGSGGERFEQASLFTKGLSVNELLIKIISQFGVHFSPAFLIQGATTTLRHGDGQWGVLLVTTFILGIIGCVAMVHGFYRIYRGQLPFNAIRLPLFFWAWILIGVLPAAVGIDVPHSNRALLALPGFLLLAGWGMAWMINELMALPWSLHFPGTHQEKNTLAKAALGSLVLIHSLLFVAYLNHYFTVFGPASATEFKDGYLDVFEYIRPYENGISEETAVNQIVISGRYGQPYIYALFSRETNPISYQGGALNRYLFVNKVTSADLERPKALVVATGEDDVPAAVAKKIIYGSDGSIRFKIYRTP